MITFIISILLNFSILDHVMISIINYDDLTLDNSMTEHTSHYYRVGT